MMKVFCRCAIGTVVCFIKLIHSPGSAYYIDRSDFDTRYRMHNQRFCYSLREQVLDESYDYKFVNLFTKITLAAA
jgi:hypothetical protein